MSIKIEVTGESLTEVADKLLAIGNNLRGTIIEEKAPVRKAPAKKEPVADAGEPAASASETTELTSAASAEVTSGGTETSTAPAAAKALDFDKDVAPVVIKFVQSKGKPFVVGILEQFGVGKASELAEDRWGELLAALEG